VKRFVLLAGLTTTALIGCGNTEPTLAGGRPIAYWVEALKAPDPRVRKEAAFKLGNAGPVEPSVFPALSAALKDSDARVRCEAVLAVLKFGSIAKEAIPVLAELKQKDADAQVRRYAARAIEKLSE
jgi:HEAT repeat protein